MVNTLKLKKDLIELVQQMRKMGFTKNYVNRFLNETLEDVKNEVNI